jgi:AcrR family transcriptional regulator
VQKKKSPVPAPTERGRRTRQAIVNAALDFMSAGKNFSSLSMREITRQAGIVPAAFYRHFKDMDELGLTLVNDCGETLRLQLRGIRQTRVSSKDIIRDSFLVFKQYVDEHPKYFVVASGERHGGSPVMREAIRAEIGRFVEEMAQDIHALKLMPDLSLATLRNVCDLVINMMLAAAGEILDWPGGDKRLQRNKVESYVQQLRIIFMGASAWRDGKPESDVISDKATARLSEEISKIGHARAAASPRAP